VKIAVVMILLMLLSACSIPASRHDGSVVNGTALRPSGKVLILGVRDGQEQGQDPAPGSGHALVAGIRKVLTEHSVPFSTLESVNLEDGYAEAKRNNFDYVMKSVITLWEDNATAWSGNGDKLKISVEVYDVRTRQLVAFGEHYRVGNGFTFLSGSPDRYIDESANGALSKMYGWTAH
jgi:hypothetical protein